MKREVYTPREDLDVSQGDLSEDAIIARFIESLECSGCGATHGMHSFSDEACPVDEAATKFKKGSKFFVDWHELKIALQTDQWKKHQL